MGINRTDRGEPVTENSWPKNKVKDVECRKRDIVIRIADWTRDKDEPAYDVEVYVKGVYDWCESKSFLTKHADRTKAQARQAAAEFAAEQIRKFLK